MRRYGFALFALLATTAGATGVQARTAPRAPAPKATQPVQADTVTTVRKPVARRNHRVGENILTGVMLTPTFVAFAQGLAAAPGSRAAPASPE